MLIRSDFHIHSEYSHDATLTIEKIAAEAKGCGFERIGITDHLNFNDPASIEAIRRSAAAVSEARKQFPFMIPGVELTPIQKAQFDYIALHGTREGYRLKRDADRFGLALALTKEELMALGIRYAVGASHWRTDTVGTDEGNGDAASLVKEYFRQQMWLACDERVRILGHPWDHGAAPWNEDFSIIPQSMHNELAAALRENGKCVECNAFMFFRPQERMRYAYAEMLRGFFESGVRITFGSDSHEVYNDGRADLFIEKYLRAAGFRDGDFYTLQESDLW